MDKSDPEWLVVQGPDFLFEVSLGSEKDTDSFMLLDRAGERTVPVMLAIADALGATLFDTSTGASLAVQNEG